MISEAILTDHGYNEWTPSIVLKVGNVRFEYVRNNLQQVGEYNYLIHT